MRVVVYLLALLFSNDSNFIRDVVNFAVRQPWRQDCSKVLHLNSQNLTTSTQRFKYIMTNIKKDPNNIPLIHCGFREIIRMDPLPLFSKNLFQSKEYNLLINMMQRHMEIEHVSQTFLNLSTPLIHGCCRYRKLAVSSCER